MLLQYNIHQSSHLINKLSFSLWKLLKKEESNNSSESYQHHCNINFCIVANLTKDKQLYYQVYIVAEGGPYQYFYTRGCFLSLFLSLCMFICTEKEANLCDTVLHSELIFNTRLGDIPAMQMEHGGYLMMQVGSTDREHDSDIKHTIANKGKILLYHFN